MGVPRHSFEGFHDFKLDAKGRVSVPADWRPENGGAIGLRLLKWRTHGVPVLKALTDDAFAAMIRSIDDDPDLNAGQKGAKKGLIFSRNTPVSINEQGKLLIPRKLVDEHGLELGGAVYLYGRGTNFDIVSPRDHEAMQQAEDALMSDLYDTVDFS